MSSLRLSVALVSFGLLPLTGFAQTTAADSPPAVNANWVEKEIEFTYMAFTTYYSCDGLRRHHRRARVCQGRVPTLEEAIQWLEGVPA